MNSKTMKALTFKRYGKSAIVTRTIPTITTLTQEKT